LQRARIRKSTPGLLGSRLSVCWTVWCSSWTVISLIYTPGLLTAHCQMPPDCAHEFLLQEVYELAVLKGCCLCHISRDEVMTQGQQPKP
jgi:hypothetical protein